MPAFNIKELWTSHDEQAWNDALNWYWKMPTVIGNLEIEQIMDKVDFGDVRNLGSSEWHAFLDLYFRWKFKGNHLNDRLDDLEKNSLERLMQVKNDLIDAAEDEFELADVTKTLNILKSPRVKGLGYPGASGLLAILFKRFYGTVDRMVIESLCVVDLPEKVWMQKIDARLKSNKDWELRDAVRVIEIMRRKADELNDWFNSDKWTPRKIDMVLWTFRNGRTC